MRVFSLVVGQKRSGDMGRVQEQQHLAKAEADIAKANDCVERQHAIIAKLKDDGHPTDIAEKILATMLCSLNALEEYRKVILGALALYRSSPPPRDASLDRMAGNGGPRPDLLDGR